MPSSDHENMSLLIGTIRKLQPQSILDCGIGCAKYGLLIREYLDGHWTGKAFHDPSSWNIKLDGIEVWADYITPVHTYLYDKIYINDAYELLVDLGISGSFDLVLMGDFIEHLDKDRGIFLIEYIRDHYLNPGGSILLSTPNFPTRINKGSGVFGNKHEVHRCRWYPKDFNFSGFVTTLIEQDLLTVTLTKE